MADISDAATRRALAKDITMAESGRASDRKQIYERLANYDNVAADTMRIGISGTPGVGKSTFIEYFGMYLLHQQKRRLAVLAIDPSSPIRGGSLLGDKTRMQELSRQANAFIRPAPTGGHLGGLTQASRESAWLAEMAGYNTVIVETVGVGQSEHDVAHLVDVFVLMLEPGGGDALQGIKRGILELADIIVVNKAEGDNRSRAEATAAEYREAIKLTRPELAQRIFLCSALKTEGVEKIWQSISDLHTLWHKDGELAKRRREQSVCWLEEEVRQSVSAYLSDDKSLRALRATQEDRIRTGKTSVYQAAQVILKALTTSQDN